MISKKFIFVSIFSFLFSTFCFGTSFGLYQKSYAEDIDISISLKITDRIIYLDTGGSSLWDQAGAWFAAHCYGGHETIDYTMEKIPNSQVYKVTINSDFTNLVFARVAKDKELDVNWENVWNKSFDLDIPSDKDLYTITGWGEEGSKICPGTWSIFANHICKAGNVVKENIVLPTCKVDGGYDSVTYCIYCGKELSRVPVIDPAHHELFEVPAVSPTCTEEGNIKYYECSVCGELYLDSSGTKPTTYENTRIPPTGHHFDETSHYCHCGELDPDYVRVEFRINYGTETGENIYLCSDVTGWGISDSNRMSWIGDGNWSYTLVRKINSTISFKFRCYGNGTDRWESDPNRSYTFTISTIETFTWK